MNLLPEGPTSFWNTLTKNVCDITSSSSDKFHKEHQKPMFSYFQEFKNSLKSWRVKHMTLVYQDIVDEILVHFEER
jgi:hypothetical protein